MPTKLQAAAADEKDEKRTKKARTLLGTLGALLGVNTEKKPSAKMSKKTETTKHTVVEESDSEAESEEEEEFGSTGSTGSEGSTGSSSSEEEEEEEEEESAESSEEEEEEEEEEGTSEEEEEKALARAVGKALNSPAVHKAFLAALPKKHRDAGAVFSPHRLAALAKKTTGARTTYGAMHALADAKKHARAADAKVLTRQAKIEARVAKVEGARRKDRVDAIVEVAKAKGRAGATTKDGRAMLRAYGMQHGTKALTEFIGTMPLVAKTKASVPRGDGGAGAPSADDQRAAMRAAATAGLSAEDAKVVLAQLDAAEKTMNGAGAGTEA